MNKKILYVLFIFSGLFAFSLCFLIEDTICAQKTNKGEATTLYIAYTCNTWGQMQPCPS